MEFTDSKPIYIQISEIITENILTGRYGVGQKIPSVREMAVLTETNPNTVMRSYARLQESEIIFNKRGRGYFVAEEAPVHIRREKRQEFIDKELPHFFKLMDLIELSFDDVRALYEEYTAGREAVEK